MPVKPSVSTFLKLSFFLLAWSFSILQPALILPNTGDGGFLFTWSQLISTAPSGILERDSLTWIPSGNTEQLLSNRNGVVADWRWERAGGGTLVLPWLLSRREGIHKSLYTPCERVWKVPGVERYQACRGHCWEGLGNTAAVDMRWLATGPDAGICQKFKGSVMTLRARVGFNHQGKDPRSSPCHKHWLVSCCITNHLRI